MALKVKDKDCLVAALKELGFVSELYDEAVALVGYEGRNREQKANIIVRKKNITSASNDLGFIKKTDGTYEMIISEYDQRTAQGKNIMENINKIYTKHVVTKQAARMGYSISSQSVDKDGRLRIRIKGR